MWGRELLRVVDHVIVQQKPTEHCKVIILQLKKKRMMGSDLDQDSGIATYWLCVFKLIKTSRSQFSDA